jgi:murein DD-endopeptidase MepM/ murein hydrolase activator NlpD
MVAGQPLGSCGNSGNSTQPHVHVQVMDGLDVATARGVPMAFRRFREWPRGSTRGELRESGLPAEGSLVEPEPPAPRVEADPTGGALPSE